MEVVQALIQKQTGLKVDQPGSSGGTKSIGNVDRKAFSDNSEYLKCVISLITFPHRPALTKIHNQLAAILRVLNSSNKVNTLELGKLCQDTDLCILDSFPWASIAPTLHKLLAHSEELIRGSNSGFRLKALSEGGT